MEISKPLDLIDRRILECVQSDGRISIVDLAQKVNLSKSPCLQRLRRLERDGYILGYRAVLAPNKVSQGYLVFVQITLNNTLRRDFEAFNKAVQSVPQILSCHMMSGGYDYILKVRTADMRAYREFLGEVIAELPGVNKTSTFPVMEDVKDTSILPIGPII